MVSWQQAGEVGLVLALAAVLAFIPATPRLGRLAAWLWQSAVIIWLYALWQWLLDRLVVATAGAERRGRWVVHFERWLHLPSEHWTQGLVLSHPLILETADRFYAWADFPGLGACLIYLWWFRRRRYWRARTALIWTTTAAAFIQAVPVAPPRLVPLARVVDAGSVFHYAVYSAGGLQQPGQLTSMPSVHVLWAALVALSVIEAGGSRWRWLVVLDPIVTIFVVVVTGNHYWLDGMVALLLLALVWTAQTAVAKWRAPSLGQD